MHRHGRLVVQLVISPSSGVEHLPLYCITLSRFNEITFTILPARIIYFSFIFNRRRQDASSVCQVRQSEGEKERGSAIPVQCNRLCFNEVQSVNTLWLRTLRRSSPVCDTEEHIMGE